MEKKDINMTEGEAQDKEQATQGETAGEQQNMTDDEQQNDAESKADGTEEGTNSTDAEQQTDTDKQEEEKDPMEQLQAQLDEMKDKYLRSVAEFDNYRKRTLKEKAELILNGGEKTITAILPVLDDMERAIANGEKTEDPAVLKEGMQIIHNKFMKTLEGMGVTKINTDNTDFDTDIHEAIAMVPGMGDDKKGKIIDCVQAGYKLNDKVIRHAKVAVGQ
jgi:molecular chaperone GrpE